ncbi:heterokaryon incompatibility protein-domain-containing protein [Boeremia exigua]|uniref:heterokaryon incompatibility protein-domain-containing protein n=1 Tax=Boeremia exigua TaxID=749465 RepID=UPI001E8EDA49|nr:heterokaryon incompatibility protein-domain-containing protein [Boeremia exigua]KAH6611905.1 heterokaryon incompatibility protein-domain-containing protein [Boeremia exigua]
MARAFEYTPLDPADTRAFRVLELLPSTHIEDSVHCELRNYSLSGDIEYEALSYAWGEDVPECPILINGLGTVDVTRSCVDALRHIRHEVRRRALWVDAICINQREDDTSRQERNHQVNLMFEIYTKARGVLVWLGPSDSSTPRTMAMLKLAYELKYWAPWEGTIFSRRKSKRSRDSTLSKLRTSASKRLLKSMFQRSNGAPKPQYHALAAIIHSSWWQRVWTLQEDILADRCVVFHGRRRIEMIALTTSSSFLLEELSMMMGKYFHLNHMARERMRFMRMVIEQATSDQEPKINTDRFVHHSSGIVLESLFNLAFLLQSKKSIDKIYGLHGIMTYYCGLPIPEPDYGKSFEVVYMETAWAWIDTRHDLSILKLAVRKESFEHLPSWVPAWHSEHPNFPRSVADSGSSILESLYMNPEVHPLFNAHHFSWDYMSNDSLRKDSWEEVQQSGPIVALLPGGQLHVFRTCCVGIIHSAVGIDKPGDYRQRDMESYLLIHIRWVKLTQSVSSTTTFEQETAMLEMFRSLDTPGIYGSEAKGSAFRDRFKMFCAWAEFILSLDLADDIEDPSHTTDTDRNPLRKWNAAVQIYAKVVRSKKSETIAVLRKHFVGRSQTDQEIVYMAKAIHEMYRSFIRVRNHSLCLLGNNNMMAVTNYWCREGDEVFVLPNTDSPFVLRKETDQGAYRLVGVTIAFCNQPDANT